MQSIAVIVLKSAVTAAIMLAYYTLVLRNKKLHTFNRFYLLATVAVSLVIPFLHFDWYTIKEATTPIANNVLQILSTGVDEEITVRPQEVSISAESIAMVAYAIVSALLLVLLALKIVWVYRVKRKCKVTSMEGYDLVHTDLQKAPFSFLNSVFWKDGIDPESETGKQVLQHELTHIKQLHTLDKLFMQVVLVVGWINPFYWYIQKELALVHEFLADDMAIEDNDTSAFAQMLLVSHYKGATNVIVNPFFYSPIKRRIVMLHQTNKTRFALLRRAMVLPLVLIPLLLFSFTVHKRASEGGDNTIVINKALSKITLVLDAGHGGQDAGAVSANVMEKELTLKVCITIFQLAREHNIDVVMTRSGDEYPTLAQRVEMANGISDAVFVSIHVNKSSQSNVAFKGYEVVVSGKNQRFSESKLLASAVMAQIKLIGRQTQLTEKGMHVLKENKHPAITIECGNMDDVADVAILEDKGKRETMCRHLLNGIVAYSNAPKKGGQ